MKYLHLHFLICGAGVKRSGLHELAYFVVLIRISIFVNQINKINRTLFPKSSDKLQLTSLVSYINSMWAGTHRRFQLSMLLYVRASSGPVNKLVG